MKILITAGGTAERIDAVRSVKNTSTGLLGMLIADEFAKQPDAEVTYVCAADSAVPEGEGIETVRVTSVESLKETLTDLFIKNRYDAVIHSMAVSDYSVHSIMPYDFNNGIMLDGSGLGGQKKISSETEGLAVIMKKAPKVIKLIKQLQPETVLIGFKLLVGVDENMLLQQGNELLMDNGCDFVFANDLERISRDEHHGLLIKPGSTFERLRTKREIAAAVVNNTVTKIKEAVKEMKIGFIGAGKTGFTLGKYFSERKVKISGYYSLNPDSALATAFSKLGDRLYLRPAASKMESRSALPP